MEKWTTVRTEYSRLAIKSGCGDGEHILHRFLRSACSILLHDIYPVMTKSVFQLSESVWKPQFRNANPHLRERNGHISNKDCYSGFFNHLSITYVISSVLEQTRSLPWITWWRRWKERWIDWLKVELTLFKSCKGLGASYMTSIKCIS